MWWQRLQRVRFGALVLTALCLCALPAQADDEDELRSFDRELLLQRAHDSVDPSNPGAGDLHKINELVDSQRAQLRELEPTQLQILDWLLGSGGNKGAIREGAELYRWMTGEGEPVVLRLRERDGPGDIAYPAPEGDERGTTWQVVVQPRADGTYLDFKYLSNPGAWQPRALTDPDELGSSINRTLVDAWKEQVPLREEAIKKEGATGLATEGLVADKAARAETLRNQLADIEKQRALMVAALDRLVLQERVFQDRAVQVASKIDEAKRKVKELAPKEAPEPAKEGEPQDAEPKKDGDSDDAQPEKDGESKKDDEPKDAEPKDAEAEAEDEKRKEEARRKAEEALMRFQFRELVVEQELRLLYITAWRAELRISLYDRVITQGKRLIDAAEAVYRDFEGKLSRIRRSRELDRLGAEQRTLTRLHDKAHAVAEKPPKGEEALRKAYDEALHALIVLNEVTSDAVGMRRAMEAKTRVEQDVTKRADAAAAAGGKAEAGADAAAAKADSSAALDPLDRFRDPRPERLDAEYCEAAARMLSHPDWDAALVARHYATVDDRILDLEAGIAIARKADGLRGRFDKALKEARASLDVVQKLYPTANNPSDWVNPLAYHRTRNIVPNERSFNDTLEGITEQADFAKKDLVLLREYRSKLRGLGARSYQIRVRRDLDGERLGSAAKDLGAKLVAAGKWLMFQGDNHLGTFVGSNWLMVLAGLGVLVGSFFGVRIARRQLDRVVRKLASKVPELRAEPVTVRAEEAEAKRSKAIQEAAAKRAEEAALAEVSKEEAGKAQKMGEGGY